MRKPLIFYLVIMLVMLSACQANVPATTPTPTLVPLSDVDLSTIAILDGDLPAGYTPSQIKEVNLGPDLNSQIINGFDRTLEKDGKNGGDVTIIIFDTPEHADKYYEEIAFNFSKGKAIDDLGDKSVGESMFVPLITGSNIQNAALIFIRCSTVVISEMNEQNAYAGLITYAKRLDSRLIDLPVCR